MKKWNKKEYPDFQDWWMKNEYPIFLKDIPTTIPIDFDTKKEYLPFKEEYGIFPEEFFQKYSKNELKQIFKLPYVRKHFYNNNFEKSRFFHILKTNVIRSQLTNTEIPVEILLKIVNDLSK